MTIQNTDPAKRTDGLGRPERSGMMRAPLALGVLLQCRTVVEKMKQNYVSTGIITGVEGELFEVELSDFDRFQLGDAVKVTIYSPSGIHTFQSVVFAKYHGAIAIIQPPALAMKFGDKREHVRVDAEGTALVTPARQLAVSGDPVEVRIKDISVAGLGFFAPNLPIFIEGARLNATVRIEFEFSCELVIVRRDWQNDNWLCGARLVLEDQEMLRHLRAFVLRQQVDKYIKRRERLVRERELSEL